MYSTIMVPLDGSELAEWALPHVEGITSGCKITNNGDQSDEVFFDPGPFNGIYFLKI